MSAVGDDAGAVACSARVDAHGRARSSGRAKDTTDGIVARALALCPRRHWHVVTLSCVENCEERGGRGGPTISSANIAPPPRVHARVPALLRIQPSLAARTNFPHGVARSRDRSPRVTRAVDGADGAAVCVHERGENGQGCEAPCACATFARAARRP
jgi:hypothetical protein